MVPIRVNHLQSIDFMVIRNYDTRIFLIDSLTILFQSL